MSQERDEPAKGAVPPSEPPQPGPEAEEATELDTAKLSDEAAAQVARAFLGTAAPPEEVSVDEAKSMLRRAGVAEAEPELAAPVVEAAPQPPPPAAPTQEGIDTGRRRYGKHT